MLSGKDVVAYVCQLVFLPNIYIPRKHGALPFLQQLYANVDVLLSALLVCLPDLRAQELEYPDVPSTDYNLRAAPANADEVNERSLPAHSKAEAEAHCAMLEVTHGF